ncbi:MAG: hypothetical protein JO193_06800 [Candidatus Eremiobacteraeota bacterium]|nr:hypothetical protein [Candidatus Eremiobacteraeota bacterium]MBV9972324.1 hypothetical protein [Candidatus Eremiobacteraeota bacterium]
MLLGIIFVVSGAIAPAKIYQHAHIPVLIPSVMPDRGVRRVYENVDLAETGKYRISFGLAPNCRGATACEAGTVAGGANVDVPVGHFEHVRLRDGTTATFMPFGCGASCSDSGLTFRWHGVVYELLLKAATKAEMIRSANSMLPR